MRTAEDELEAAIWQAMTTCRATVPDALKFIELLTFAAQRYAAGDSEVVTELRRKVLERDTAEQTSASTSGGVARTAPELHPPGSGAGPQMVGDGGATLSTGASIPGAVTSGDAWLSTGAAGSYPQVAS